MKLFLKKKYLTTVLISCLLGITLAPISAYAIIPLIDKIVPKNGAFQGIVLPANVDSSGSAAGQALISTGNGTEPHWASISGAGLGDVSGPASSIDSDIVLFDGTTGKLIKDSGYKIVDLQMWTLDNNNNFFSKNSGGIYPGGTGTYNIMMGESTGGNITSGGYNIFIGMDAGMINDIGGSNIFFGNNAGFSNTSGNSNNFWGTYAGYGNISGSDNNFFGNGAGLSNATGSNSIFIGTSAGYNQTGSNTFIIDAIYPHRATALEEQQNALLYGTFAPTASGQQLTVNGTLNIGNGSGVVYSLPTDAGTNGYVLTTNGAGIADWQPTANYWQAGTLGAAWPAGLGAHAAIYPATNGNYVGAVLGTGSIQMGVDLSGDGSGNYANIAANSNLVVQSTNDIYITPNHIVYLLNAAMGTPDSHWFLPMSPGNDGDVLTYNSISQAGEWVAPTAGTMTYPSAGIAVSTGSAWGTSIADGTGWLHNNGSGAYAYTIPTKADVGLGNVENVALSTWPGSTNITTLGTIGTGTWHGNAIADQYISSASIWNSKQPGSLILTALADLSYSSGSPFIKMTGTSTFALDTSTYLTGNQNITLSGFVTGSGTTSIATTLAGTVGVANGGTGLTSFNTGDLLYASASNTLAALPAGTSTYVLTANGAGVAPSWQAPATNYWQRNGTTLSPLTAGDSVITTGSGTFGGAADQVQLVVKSNASAASFSSATTAGVVGNPTTVDVSPNGNYVFIGNNNGGSSGTLARYSIPGLTNGITGVTTDATVYDISVTPNNNYLYVAQGNYIERRATSNLALSGSPSSVSLGATVYSVGVSPSGNYVYGLTTSAGAKRYLTSDLSASGSTEAISSAKDMVVSSDGSVYIVTGTNVYKYSADLSSQQASIALTTGWRIAISPDGSYVYVYNRNGSASWINKYPASLASLLLSSGNLPYGFGNLSVSTNGAYVYVINDTKTVYKLDGSTLALYTSTSVAGSNGALTSAIDSYGNYVFAANYGSTDVNQFTTAGGGTQLANLQEWQSNTGLPLAYVDSQGKFTTTNNLSVSGTITTSGYTLPNSLGTSGQVLMTNGAGAANWTDFGIGTFLYAGVSGSILYTNSSGQMAGDSNHFYWDATSHSMGLGTSTPNAFSALDIEGKPLLLGGMAADPGTSTAGMLYYNSQSQTLKLYTDSWKTITLDTSSLRFKHDIMPLQDNWDSILKAEPVSFVYNGDAVTSIGYIAEDFDALGLYDLVSYSDQGLPSGINYSKIPLYLLEVIKEQQKDINSMKLITGLADSVNGTGTFTVNQNTLSSGLSGLLANVGIAISNGVTTIKSLATETFTAKTAKVETATIQKLQMVASNGDIYCIWIGDNGEWQKTKGNCSSLPATTPSTPVTAAPTTSEPVAGTSTQNATPETVQTEPATGTENAVPQTQIETQPATGTENASASQETPAQPAENAPVEQEPQPQTEQAQPSPQDNLQQAGASLTGAVKYAIHAIKSFFAKKVFPLVSWIKLPQRIQAQSVASVSIVEVEKPTDQMVKVLPSVAQASIMQNPDEKSKAMGVAHAGNIYVYAGREMAGWMQVYTYDNRKGWISKQNAEKWSLKTKY